MKALALILAVSACTPIVNINGPVIYVHGTENGVDAYAEILAETSSTASAKGAVDVVP